MKKSISAIFGVLLLLVSILGAIIADPKVVEAADMTFSGTVSDKTTSDVLYLKTSGGTVEIKIDSTTDTSSAKFVLPGSGISATCYRGSDEYWHASKLSGNGSTEVVTVDSSNSATVKGTIAKGTSQELIYLVTNAGTMQIKVDTSTDFSGVKYLIIGKTVQIVCARGSDAYMHAISVSDANGTTYSSSGISSGTGVTGTVEKGTTSSILYLSTSAGTMEFVLDLTTDASACRVLMPGESITVNFYRGDDAWNHASKMVNNSSSASSVATLDDGSSMTVTGTVKSDTNEGTLYLKTSGGTMQIRLDSSTDFSRCPIILKDKNISVTCKRGSDEYYHAVSVSAN